MIQKILISTSLVLVSSLPSANASTLAENAPTVTTNSSALSATVRSSRCGTKQKLNRTSSLTELCESNIDEAVLDGNTKFDQQTVDRLNRKGLVAAIEPALDRFVLYKGRLLLASSDEVHLLLANADIEVAAKSLVYICDNGCGTCTIMNLHDEHVDAVKVHVGNDEFCLPPGRQLTLTSQIAAGFDEINLSGGILFRSLVEFRPVPTIKAYQSQFSMVSAARNLPAILKLAKSHTRESQKLFKTAAAVLAVGRYPDDFRLSLSDATVPNQ